MSTEYKSFRTFNPDGRGSTGFYVKIEDNKVTEVLDVSTYDANYYTSDIDEMKPEIGKTGTTLSEEVESYNDRNERRFYIYEEDISEQEYEWESRNQMRDNPEYRYFKVWGSHPEEEEIDVEVEPAEFYAKIEGGKVAEIFHPKYDNNWALDEWGISSPYEMVGRSYKKLLNKLDRGSFNGVKISKQEYEGEKVRLKIKDSQLDRREEVAAERERARVAQGKSKFAEREDMLDSVTRRVLTKRREKEEKLAEHIRDEKYYTDLLESFENRLAEFKKNGTTRRTLRNRLRKDNLNEEEKKAIWNELFEADSLVSHVYSSRHNLKKAREEVSKLSNELAKDNLDKKVATARMLAAKRHIIATKRAQARDAQGTDKFAEREAMYRSFQAFSGDEKGSTGFYAKIEDGKVAEVLDVSTYETNYDWDLERPPYYMVGESYEELSEFMEHYYDYYDDSWKLRIREEAISKEEYEREKVRLKKEEIELQQRGIEYKFFAPVESDFGASTGFYAKIENGKVAEIIDVSTYATSYGWDLENPPYDMIGKSGKELSEAMAHYYDDKDFGDRRPWIAEENLREQEYEMKARNSLERAGVVYKSFQAFSGDEKDSTRFCAKIENGKVTEVVGMEDRWHWNAGQPSDMIGKSGKELLHVMDHYCDRDHYHDGINYIKERAISEQEYEEEKTRLKIIENQLEQREEVAAERKRARAAQGTDKFAEREAILQKATDPDVNEARPNRRTLRSRRAKDPDVEEARPNRRTLRSRRAKLSREEEQAEELRKLNNQLRDLRRKGGEEEQVRELEKELERKVATARMLAAKRHIIATKRAQARAAQGTDKFAEREAILQEATKRVLAKHREKEEKLEKINDVDHLADRLESSENRLMDLAEFRKNNTGLDDAWKKQVGKVSRLRNELKGKRKEVSEARKELAKDEKNMDKKIVTARVAAAKKHIKESR